MTATACFASPRNADPRHLAAEDAAAWQTSLRDFLPEIRVSRAFGHGWTLDPFSLGTWCTYRPELARYAEELQRAEAAWCLPAPTTRTAGAASSMAPSRAAVVPPEP